MRKVKVKIIKTRENLIEKKRKLKVKMIQTRER